MNNQPAEAEPIQCMLCLNAKRNWYLRVNGSSEFDETFFTGKVFFLKDGRIGMEYGGRVIVRSIELWMSDEQEG